MPSDPIPVCKIIEREIKLVRPLGEGSFGEVFLAEPLPGRKRSTFCYPEKMAVKVIHKRLCGADQTSALEKELNALQRLQHPCIVGYLGVWVEGCSRGKYKGSACLAMNFCDGGDLEHFLREARRANRIPSQDTIARLMTCVFAGLNYSHTHHVIHRDIKPANIFLVNDPQTTAANPAEFSGRALVGDYGLARPLDQTMQLVKSRVGTPCYCSPEIVAGETYTSKTDIFSAGVMFYELMTHRSPFYKNTYTDVQCFYQILHHDPLPRLRQLCEGHFSGSLVEIVCRCLAKTERDRPSAFDVLTSFSTRLPRQLKALGIPVYPPSSNPPQQPDSPDAQPMERTAASQKDTPVAEDPPPTDVMAPHHNASSDSAVPKSVTRLATLLRHEFPQESDGPLEAAAGGIQELFLLLKVVGITHGGLRPAADLKYAKGAADHQRVELEGIVSDLLHRLAPSGAALDAQNVTALLRGGGGGL